MFDSLAEKLQDTLADVRNRGTLREQDVDAAMRGVRLALLEADVNFKVARELTAVLRERCSGAEIIGTLNPGQQVVKIVAEELTALMGGAGERMSLSARAPTVFVLAHFGNEVGARVQLPWQLLGGTVCVTMVMALASGLAALRSLRLIEPVALLR